MSRTPTVRTAVPLALAAGLLLVSGAGGAVAGAMVTGTQIRNGTVTGADVKDGSLGAAEIAPATRSTYARLQGYEHRRTAVAVFPGASRTVELRCGAGRHVLHGSARWLSSTEAAPFALRPDSTGIVVQDVVSPFPT